MYFNSPVNVIDLEQLFTGICMCNNSNTWIIELFTRFSEESFIRKT